jgi:hypothetical protein
MSTEQWHECSVCNEAFHTRAELVEHMKSKHGPQFYTFLGQDVNYGELWELFGLEFVDEYSCYVEKNVAD